MGESTYLSLSRCVRSRDAMKRIIACGLVLLLAVNAPVAQIKKRTHSSKVTNAPRPLNDHERALHVLDRFTFGARPGEAERVLAVGLDKWFEEQLQPASIPNSTLDAKLNQFRTDRKSTRLNSSHVSISDAVFCLKKEKNNTST